MIFIDENIYRSWKLAFKVVGGKCHFECDYCEVCLRQPNITYVESKLVRPHTPLVRACMFNRLQHNNVASHHHLSFQQHDPCIVMSSHVSGQLGYLSLLGHIRGELTHVSIISARHPFRFARALDSPASMLNHLWHTFRTAGA